MEFYYPDNFVRVFNDEEKDEVGEYEILVNSPFTPPIEPINNYEQSYPYNDDDSVDSEDLTRGKDDSNNTPDYLPSFISNFPNNLMQTFPINLATSFIPMGQFGGQNAAPMGPPPAYIPAKTDAKVKSLGQGGPDGGPGFGPGFGPGGGPGFGPGVSPGGGPGYGAGIGPGVKAVSGGSLRPCLYKFTYIWQRNGRSYWAYITRIDARSVSGWRWLGWRWVFFGVDTRRIDSFVCY